MFLVCFHLRRSGSRLFPDCDPDPEMEITKKKSANQQIPNRFSPKLYLWLPSLANICTTVLYLWQTYALPFKMSHIMIPDLKERPCVISKKVSQCSLRSPRSGILKADPDLPSLTYGTSIRIQGNIECGSGSNELNLRTGSVHLDPGANWMQIRIRNLKLDTN